MESPALGIQIYRDAITREDCQEMVDWLEEQSGWSPAQVYAGLMTDQSSLERREHQRSSDNLFLPFMSYANPDVVTRINRQVWSLMNSYALGFDFGFRGVEDMVFNRYRIGEFYKVHTDNGNTGTRVMSALLYLNDVEEGGGTHFPLVDLTIEPVAGTLVIFPSNFIYPHEALPPVSGVKYSVAYWAVG